MTIREVCTEAENLHGSLLELFTEKLLQTVKDEAYLFAQEIANDRPPFNSDGDAHLKALAKATITASEVMQILDKLASDAEENECDDPNLEKLTCLK